MKIKNKEREKNWNIYKNIIITILLLSVFGGIAAATTPTLEVSPLSGPQKTSFQYTGNDLTPTGDVDLHILKPDGTEYIVKNLLADNSGKISYQYLSTCDSLVGSYTAWVIDRAANDIKSNDVTHTISASPDCTVTPSITVVIPNGRENWQAGTIQTIQWSHTGDPGSNVKIELLKGGVAKIIKSSVSIGSGSYSWNIPNNQKLGTDYKVRITSTTNSAYTDTSNENFAIVGPTPFTVSGRVTTSDGTGIEGIQMIFTLVSGIKIKVPATVKTDANGYWGQEGFMSGTTYRITPNNPILTIKDYLFTLYYLDFSSEKTDLNFIGTPTTHGIDVSHHNGVIDWDKVLTDKSNYKFAYVKATESIDFLDGQLKNNMVGGNDANGILKGVYHFARPDINEKGADEANYFISMTKEYLKDGYLRPMLDIENPHNVNLCQKLGKAELSKWVNEWMKTVRDETGIDPILYVNGEYAQCLDDSVKANNELWIASPDTNGGPSIYPYPPNIYGWSDWAIWQYSWTGKVDGILEPKTGVDLDILNGDYLDDLIIKSSKIS